MSVCNFIMKAYIYNMKYDKMSKILGILLYFNYDCCVVSMMMIYEKSKRVGDVMF
jgi:hypothetical protein